MSDYLNFLLLFAAGWVNRDQRKIIDYLLEENAVYRELLGRRPRFTDSQRRRLAIKAKALDAKVRAQIARIVTPDTLPQEHAREQWHGARAIAQP